MRNDRQAKLTDPGSSTLAVGLDELKEHLLFEEIEQDKSLRRLINAATRAAEAYQRRCLITRTITVRFDRGWPLYFDGRCWRPGFWLPRGPYVDTPTLSYIDTAGASQALVADTDFEIDDAADPAAVLPAWGVTWPTPRAKVNAITFTCSCGYGAAAASVPQPTRTAICRLVAYWFTNREAAGQNPFVRPDLPDDVRQLLDVEARFEIC